MLSLKERIDARLQRIANVLLLNASFIDNLGLLNGKMGIAIFFYHYARYTGNEVYENYAGELIDEIYEEISANTPVDFANGLTGIGWGIEYLVQNGFVEADTDEALEEMDAAIYKNKQSRPLLIENENDLFGFGFYYISRLKGNKKDDSNLITLLKKQQLIFLTDECERLLIHRRYLDFNIPLLKLSVINSVFYFLIEMYTLDLFPSKVNKLLYYLSSYLEACLVHETDWAEKKISRMLVRQISYNIKDDKLKQLYIGLDHKIDKEIGHHIEEELVESFVKTTWYNLVATLDKTGSDISIIEKAFSIIDNEEDWNQRLDKLNVSNLGLTGLAGIGLGLINVRNEGKKEFKNEGIETLVMKE